MRIVPAVDILDGKCVNLIQGDYDRETVFSEDPVAQAVRFRDQGAELVHIVDLDGAKTGRCCVDAQLREIAKAGVAFEIGGGIRSMDAIDAVIEIGAERVILGTAAHGDPDLLKEAVAKYPEKITVGIDAKGGHVALEGWLDVTETGAVEFAMLVEQAGVARIIYTDILSDGMMRGPNIEVTRVVASSVDIPVTASGGVSTLDNIRDLAKLETDGVDEIITGRALYLNAFTLKEAIAATKESAV